MFVILNFMENTLTYALLDNKEMSNNEIYDIVQQLMVVFV